MHNAMLKQLDLVEQQFNQVAAFLAGGDAPQLQTAAATLHALSLDLARLLQTPQQNLPAAQRNALRQRLQALARRLPMLRDGLSRQAAHAERALQVVVPTAPKSTYSGGSSVYGAVARQSGAFRVLAA